MTFLSSIDSFTLTLIRQTKKDPSDLLKDLQGKAKEIGKNIIKQKAV